MRVWNGSTGKCSRGCFGEHFQFQHHGFNDLVDQAGVSGDYTADGVTTTIRYNIAENGNLTGTTSPTDLAIQGNGFFLVKDASGTIFMTRAGSFVPDQSGNLVNSAGYTLMGYNIGPGGTGVTNTVSGLTRLLLRRHRRPGPLLQILIRMRQR